MAAARRQPTELAPIIVDPRDPSNRNPRTPTSPALNPYRSPSAFDKIYVNSIEAAGLFQKVTGNLEHKFDPQSAPGINGCYIIFKGYEACSLSIEMLVWNEEQWDTLEKTLAILQPRPVKGTPKPVDPHRQREQGLDP